MSDENNRTSSAESKERPESTGTRSDTIDVPSKDFGFLSIPSYTRRSIRSQPCGSFKVHTISHDIRCRISKITRIPTLTQAGYAVGLLLVTPLGDLVRRRPLLLLLVLSSGSLSIVLALAKSAVVFEVISFFIGVLTVTPQVLIPLAADLSPPHRRAASISIVFAGLLLGILIARVLAGVIAQFSSWRNVYFMAVGVQYAMLLLLYLVLPDFPAKSPEIGYFGILKSMAIFAVTEPILIQACLVSCAGSACFTNFWVTLTFLLGGPPYRYTDLDIGLFGLVGMLGVMTAPFVGRFVDTLISWNASVLATFILLAFQAVQTAAGGINIGAVIVATFGLDVGRQMQQVSLSASIFGIDPKARSRLNAVYIFSVRDLYIANLS
ncbi:hypothetical protein M422DRAFT_229522 [Sphaerobolus stellatus SS14]|uniref:Major facilitator superfamily (MFS) profile domain-containing protein n=1 Tax=Sphaerobolus stellatus (strain SS14) TaxID=990650 RepID=A0A0C9VT51_SPHS4|nr:hypothetical protein M422DRAFT_229522 [Sphaerobolus stellatus SS14]